MADGDWLRSRMTGKLIPPGARDHKEQQAEQERIRAKSEKARKAKPMTEAELRALIDAFPPQKVQRCPEAPRDDEDSPIFDSGRTRRIAL